MPPLMTPRFGYVVGCDRPNHQHAAYKQAGITSRLTAAA